MRVFYMCSLIAAGVLGALYIFQPMQYCLLPDSGETMTNPKSSNLSNVAEAQSPDWKNRSDEYWRNSLTPEQYAVRNGGTERPGTGKYYHFDEQGNYYCSNCGQLLFSSKSKYESGSGWPSFSEVAKGGAVELIEDRSHGMTRTEVRCSRCAAHLGHVFDDGPGPEGKRYCINSVSLEHKPAAESSSK